MLTLPLPSESVLLIESSVKHIAPNIALMKWARFCEDRNIQYKYVIGMTNDIKINPKYILMSCIFSFQSKMYLKIISYYKKMFPDAIWIIGGPFVTSGKEWWKNIKTDLFPTNIYGDQNIHLHEGLHPIIENLVPLYTLDKTNKNIITYSSRGCTNKCKYCIVPVLEGPMQSFKSISNHLSVGLKEIDNPKSIVLYDNNFTAHEHFNKIIDELVNSGLPVDIHGLHVSQLDEEKAKQLSRLKWASQNTNGTPYIRFSFDKMSYRDHVDRALELCIRYNIKAQFFCYMLYNFTDSPKDFWNRLVYAHQISIKHGKTIFLFPQRYEPLDSLERNRYISPKWESNDLLIGLARMYTYLHGFLPASPSMNIFRWLGYNYDEFIERTLNFVKVKKYSPIKKDAELPNIDKMLVN